MTKDHFLKSDYFREFLCPVRSYAKSHDSDSVHKSDPVVDMVIVLVWGMDPCYPLNCS